MSSPIPSTYDLFRSGLRARMAAHDAAELPKVGTLRGGNTGIFIDDATIAGACHRLSVLRFLGIPINRSPEEMEEWERKQLMFEGGHSNEDNWAAVLEASPLMRDAGLSIKRETEIPSVWVLKHGGQEITITGRPDIVIGKTEAGDFVPIRGIELKCTSSAYSNVDYLFEGSPKLDHLAQAAHYLMALGINEYELWYTSRVDFHATHFLERWPKANSPFSRFVEYGWYKDKATGRMQQKPKKAQPALSGYMLRFGAAGFLEYIHLTAADLGASASWKQTPITKDRIVDYYRYVADTARMKDMGPRVTNLTSTGDKHRFLTCDYCDLKAQCIKGEKLGFDGWIDLVKKRATTPPEPKVNPNEAMDASNAQGWNPYGMHSNAGAAAAYEAGKEAAGGLTSPKKTKTRSRAAPGTGSGSTPGTKPRGIFPTRRR